MTVLLALSLALGSVMAKPIEISIWHKEHKETIDVLSQISQEFQRKHPGVQIRWEKMFVPTYKTAIMKASRKHGRLPDMALVPADFLGLHQELGFSVIPKDFVDSKVDPQVRQQVVIAGRSYAAPIFAGNHLMLFYNKKLVIHPAQSWSDFVAQKPGFDKLGVGTLAVNYGEMYWFVPVLSAFGGWPLDAQNRVQLNRPSTAKALTFYRQMRDQGVIRQTCSYRCPFEDFLEGKFAYAINGQWNFSGTQKALGADFGVTTLPKIQGKTPRPMSSFHVLVYFQLPQRGRKHAILKMFSRYLQTKKSQGLIANQARLLSVRRDVSFSNVEDPLRHSMEQLKLAKPMPLHKNMGYAWEGMRYGFRLFMNDQGSAVDAAKAMQEYTEKIIKSSRP